MWCNLPRSRCIREGRLSTVVQVVHNKWVGQRLCGAMALRVLHPERVALELLHLCRTQLAPERVFVVEEDVALPVAGLAGECLVPVRILQQRRARLRTAFLTPTTCSTFSMALPGFQSLIDLKDTLSLRRRS